MDQVREREERDQAAEAERLARERAAEAARAEADRAAEEEGVAAALAAKRARLADEPSAGEAGRLALMLRLPNGQRLQRAFRSTDSVGMLYDFVDTQCEELGRQQQYRLVSTMPRRAFEERETTLEAAGIQNQFVLMVE